MPTAPYRGAGRPEASVPDRDRRSTPPRAQLGIDPVELRRRNLVRAFPHRTALGWTYDSGDFERCLDTRARAGRRAIAGRPASARRAPERRAGSPGRRARPASAWRCASSAPAGCSSTPTVTRDGDGVVVAVGSTPTGQGHQTLFAQIAADRLGIDPERVTVRTGDTDAIADGVGSFASRSTAMGGSAVAAAADDLLARQARAAPASSPTRSSPPAPTRRSSRSTRATGQVRVRRLVAVDDAGPDRQPAARRGAGRRRRGAGPRRRADRGACTTATAARVAARLRAADRGRDPRVRDRVRRVAVAAEPARASRASARAARSARPPRSPTRSRTRSAAPPRPAVHRREGLAGAAVTWDAARSARCASAARRRTGTVVLEEVDDDTRTATLPRSTARTAPDRDAEHRPGRLAALRRSTPPPDAAGRRSPPPAFAAACVPPRRRWQ